MTRDQEPDTIAILDDEPDRIAAMKPLLDKHARDLKVVTFLNAPDMIAWLRDNVAQCQLICLDHDLGPNQVRDGVPYDPGTGRDVADLLATCEPNCPIIIHTTNIDARPGMIAVLQDAGWTVTYVSPYENVLWVREVWINEVVLGLQGDLQ